STFAVAATAAFAIVLVPVHRVAVGYHGVLQVEPVGSAAEADIQASHRDFVNVEAIRVFVKKRVSEVLAAGRTGAEDSSAVLSSGDRPVNRSQHVARVFPGAELETAYGGVARQCEGVAGDKAEIEYPAIDCSADGSVVIEHLRRRWNRSQRQAENCEPSDMHFHDSNSSGCGLESTGSPLLTPKMAPMLHPIAVDPKFRTAYGAVRWQVPGLLNRTARCCWT